MAKHLGKDFTFGVEETQVAVFEAVFARGCIRHRTEFVREFFRRRWCEEGVVSFC
jgi:hypothetical protein